MVTPDSVRTRIFAAILLAGLAVQFACGPQVPRPVSDADRKAIADSIQKLVTNAYDLTAPNPVQRMMSLYPDSGPVYSTASGHISTTRAELEHQIGEFWKYVGSNMRNPKWEWTAMHVDVLAPDAAVLTASYRVPHMTPMNMQHVIAGAWTAVFVNRGGKWVVIQEHLSDVPAAIADSAARAAMPQMQH
jgi:hypothetical protein